MGYRIDVSAQLSMRRRAGVVNSKYSCIFNGVFEMQKSAKNKQVFVEMRTISDMNSSRLP